ncbi:MAG: D-alanyl-D-alanine carboxypeptidase family protein [Lachnospiraceae bacterium]|nr:D-alanyl-D-alanine carboxypeptidase family protein [Lachnospiraceae bacterium]
MKKFAIIMFCFLFTFTAGYSVNAEMEVPESTGSEETGDKLNLTAKSGLVMEASTGKIIYEKNSTEALPPASVTKVMTLLLIFEALDEGKIHLDDEVSVSEHAASMGGSQVFLEASEVQSVEVLIKSIVIASGNDAAVAMAEFVAGSEDAFVQKMNQKAKELKMEQTVFKNCCGLDTDGHVTSAKDIALMSRELITKHPKVFEYSGIWMDEFTHKTKKGESVFTLSNTNKMIKQYQGCTGLKTGSTSQAKFCISATAKRNDISLIAVVMASNTSKDRIKDASALLDYGFANCQMYEAPDLSKKIEPIKIIGGDKDTIKVKMKKQFKTILTPEENPKQITYNIQRKKHLQAPLKKGADAGWVTYYLNGSYIGKVKLVTEEAVKKMTFAKSIERVAGYYFHSGK